MVANSATVLTKRDKKIIFTRMSSNAQLNLDYAR